MKDFNLNTIAGTSLKNAHQFPDKLYIMSRYDKEGRRTEDIHKYTWGEVDSIVRDQVCCGLYTLGFQEFERAAVFSPNRPRWIFSALAPMLFRGAMVPIYPTSKSEDIWWILHDSGAKFCFCGSKEHLDKVLEVKDKLENLEKIFIMDPIEEKPDDMVMTFDELLELGKNNQDKKSEIEKITERVDEDDMVILMYTSGTTGRPKGVMLNNRNIVSQREIIESMDFRQDDVFMVHLPLCHSYGFSADLMAGSYVPAVLAIVDSLDPAEIRWGLQTFRPTAMNSVPRLWERTYITINTLLKERPPFMQKLFKRGIELGKDIYLRENQGKEVPASLKLRSRLYAPLFKKVKKRAGLDRLRFCSTGGGPISSELIIFFGGIGINIYQGYGLTETSPIINANTLKDNKIGTVGKPLPGVEEKIAEDGEILVRGPQVMKGYWNNPEANAESFTEDGFFKTGDIGFFDKEGYLTITDRKKELMKTSGGKYVAPQPVENDFNTDPYIERVVLVGDNRKFVSALVVPDFEAIKEWAKNEGIEFSNNTEIANHPKVRELIQERIDLVNPRHARYEQIKKFAIVDQPFTEEGGEITPTQKIKRRIIEEKYKDLIDDMYGESLF